MKRSKRFLMMGTGIVVLVGVMLAMMGVFRTNVIKPPEETDHGRSAQTGRPAPERTGTAQKTPIEQWYEAVGTVQSREKSTLSARISGRITRVLVNAGDHVQQGALLVELDRRQLNAKLEQAREAVNQAQAVQQQASQALSAAQAGLTEATAHYRRIRSYYRQEAATKAQLEQAERRYRQADAGMRQAQEAVAAAKAGAQQAQKAVSEAEIALGYGLITAPYDGQIADRLVDPGDLAGPGKPLILLQRPKALRFAASVREGLIDRIHQDQALSVRVDAIGIELKGRVEEVIPAADPASRSFLVKVALPARDGLYPGMFGRLLVPLGERIAVLVPTDAVRRVGQLELVTAQVDGRWTDLYVKTGRTYDGQIEIVSGLNGSERIALE